MGYIARHILWERRCSDTRLRDGEIWVGDINVSATEAIRHDYGAVLLECYIDPSYLRNIAKGNGLSPGELLEAQILPDAPHMKSGNFGEILARSVLQEWRDYPRFPAFRWRNRAHKNDTVRGPDLLGYVMSENGEPREEDVLVICEVKTRVASINKMVVKEAFDDVKRHYISKLANSLYFLQIWLRQQGQEDEASRFARFANPHKMPFNRRLVPCVVHEHRTWEDRFLEELPRAHKLGESVEVIVICVESVSEWIDAVHEAAIACAGD